MSLGKDMSTYLELKAKAEKLLQQAEEARQKEIAEVIADIKNKMALYDLTPEDLGFTGRGSRKSKGVNSQGAVQPRYRGPEGQLWSGRGRQPAWLKEAIGQGKSKE